MKSIRHKIVIMTGILVFLVSTTLTFFAVYRMEEIVRASNAKYIKALGSEVALQTDAYLNNHIGYLEGHQRALSIIDKTSQAEMQDYVYQMKDGRTDILYVYYNTPKDTGYFVSSDGWEPPSDYSWEDKEWIKTLRTIDGVYIDEPSIDSVTNRLVIVLRAKIVKEQIAGYLNYAIDINNFSTNLFKGDIPEDTRMFILDQAGNIVATNEVEKLVNNPTTIPNISDYTDEFQLSSSTVMLNNKTYMSIPLNSANWTLWIGVKNEFLSRGVMSAIIGFILIYMISTAATVLYTRHFSKIITRPLITLTNMAKEISIGNYDNIQSQNLIGQRDEIGQLSVAFSEMQTGIISRTEELQALYEEMSASEETLRENYTELEQYKEEVEQLAYYDSLTGLPNRKKLINDLKLMWENNQLSDVLLVLISYKELNHYNATLGQLGIERIDTALARMLSHSLVEKVVETDKPKLYSINPGRFFVVSKESHSPYIIAFGESLKNLQVSESHLVRLSLIAGAYRMPHESQSYSEELLLMYLRYVETAMLEEKTLTWFDDSMLNKKAYEDQLENDLVSAIDNNELFIVYQKKFDMRRNLIGAEALVRWEHPVLGFVSPGIFVPIAEKAGLIDVIDRFVAKSVAADLSSRIKQGISIVPIAINLSVHELIDPQLTLKLTDIIQHYNVPAEYIVVEVTETAFSEKIDIISRNVIALKNAGFKVHLDDFGTGYSSLSYLSAFELDAIKIDISFTRFIETNHKIKSIVQSIIDLSKAIDARVIAEGVETESQMHMLTEMGCDYFQGFYLSRPQPNLD